MFTNFKTLAALSLVLGLASGVAQAQSFGVPQPTGYPQPVGFPQLEGYPAPAPAPVMIPEPPVRLGFQWAMCDYGMNVAALREGGLAHQIGLLPGDIIVQINTFQIGGWDQYCLALQDAVYNRGGQVEMWLYRPTPAGYELQYVAFTLHQEQVIVVVPCCYHQEKCHGAHVSCWTDRLVHLNHCWEEHCHHGGKASNHNGLNVQFLGQGVKLNFNKGGVSVNLGNLMQKNGHGNFGGQFGNGQHQFKPQIKTFNGNSNFQKQFGSGFQPKFNGHNSSNSGSQMNSHHRSSNGGNSMKSFSSQFSRSGGGGGGMKSFGGFGQK